MEATIVVLRPKHDIFMDGDLGIFSNIDILIDDEGLLSTNLLLDVEPSQALCNHLYNITGGDSGGLKGKRAINMPPTINSVGALYCIPLDKTDELCSLQNNKLSFCPLDKWFEYVLKNKFTLNSLSYMASRIQNWITEKYTIPGAMSLLFSPSSDDRFKWSISNPAFLETSIHFPFSSPNSLQSKYNHCDTLARMESCDRCEITKSNPLFGSNLSFKYKVDKIVINKHWGAKEISDSHVVTYHKQHPELSFISASASRKFMKQSFPLNHSINTGNVDAVRNCLQQGCSISQQNGYFETPIHLSAEKGQLDILKLILEETKCDVNITNNLGQSLLHVAVINGRSNIVDFLLKRGIDLNIKDRFGKMALHYCDEHNSIEHEECYKLLRRHVEEPVGTIDVYLMDSTCVQLRLLSQADTTVAQLHDQMMKELNLPSSCGHLFTIWICSKNLQLQLKPEHRPIQQLNNWKRTIVGKLTDQPPELEDPELYWKRDALLSLKEENSIKNPIAIKLLYLEAYHNYTKSLYLCTYHDVVLLAGILMQLFFGDYKEPFDYFSKKPNLFGSLIPSHMLACGGQITLTQHIKEQYKAYSEKCANKYVALHQAHFLKVCRQLTTYASAFFTGYRCSKNRVKSPIFIGVNDVGIHIITVSPREMVKSFLYNEIEWGFVQASGWQELHVKTKSNKQQAYIYLTKQANLINNLMKKLCELNSAANQQQLVALNKML